MAYRADMPAFCPGDEAYELEARLFRACFESPPSDEDYRPHNESTVPQKQKNADPAKCAGWGLSVWTDEDELRHAREVVMPWMKRRHIFISEVASNEGRLSSPGKHGHHTYWAYAQTNLRQRAQSFLEPEGN